MLEVIGGLSLESRLRGGSVKWGRTHSKEEKKRDV